MSMFKAVASLRFGTFLRNSDKQGESTASLEQLLVFYVTRSCFYFLVDLADVFANKSEKHDLNAAKKINWNHSSSPPGWRAANHLLVQIKQGHDSAEEKDQKTEHGNDP